MLSFLFRIANDYEQAHGFRPNLMYMNQAHYRCLKSELDAIPNLDAMAQLLGMEIVLSDEYSHPHVAWSAVDWQRAVAV